MVTQKKRGFQLRQFSIFFPEDFRDWFLCEQDKLMGRALMWLNLYGCHAVRSKLKSVTEKLTCIVKLTFSNHERKDHAHTKTNIIQNQGRLAQKKIKSYNIPYLLNFNDSYVQTKIYLKSRHVSLSKFPRVNFPLSQYPIKVPQKLFIFSADFQQVIQASFIPNQITIQKR